MVATISKILSGNDLGVTGSHQAGVCVPKAAEYLTCFPALDGDTKNPRELIEMRDESGKIWAFTFIWYNGKKFGGTRNEYRLTGMTRYLRERGCAIGDCLHIQRDSFKKYRIWTSKAAVTGIEQQRQIRGALASEVTASAAVRENDDMGRNLDAEIVPRRVWTITVRN